jgi:hypothetical protein
VASCWFSSGTQVSSINKSFYERQVAFTNKKEISKQTKKKKTTTTTYNNNVSYKYISTE